MSLAVSTIMIGRLDPGNRICIPCDVKCHATGRQGGVSRRADHCTRDRPGCRYEQSCPGVRRADCRDRINTVEVRKAVGAQVLTDLQLDRIDHGWTGCPRQ